jgi:integrase/recombinase XerD
MTKRVAKRAGGNKTVSPHWLRHADGSHALERGATLGQVQTTLGLPPRDIEHMAVT